MPRVFPEPAAPLTLPRLMLFDWHGTLVNTHDAMFSAMEDMLPQLEDLGLVERLLPEAQCRTSEDAKLVRYIRIFRRLHPRILSEQRVSRTDIFNAIFGQDREAKAIAHKAYNAAYRRYFGQVHPFQEGVYDYLRAYRALGIRLGVATNRNREFLDQELKTVDNGRWRDLFDVTLCAGDVTEYKPDPEIILNAVRDAGETPDLGIWYVGDSYVDMITAHNARVTAVFYNGGGWDRNQLRDSFPESEEPHLVVRSLEELTDRLVDIEVEQPGAFSQPVGRVRPSPYPAPEPPPARIEPDWHPAVASLHAPKVMLFDWHATLVDTLDAMYHAVDDMLPEFDALGLMDALACPSASRSPEDARLIEYVREHARLHPKIRADRKISRTDIFEVLFRDNEDAKALAHKVFNRHYRNHYGSVQPFEPQVSRLLAALRQLPVRVGVITNRDREFFEHELDAVEGTGWSHLFDTEVCGDDTERRKPHPDPLMKAASRLGITPGKQVWYVGDSTTDIISAHRAGMTAVFFNGAQWDQPWLNQIFPGTEAFPYRPDVVVNDFSEFWALVSRFGSRST